MLILADDLLEIRIDDSRGAQVCSIRVAGHDEDVLAFYDWSSPLPAGGPTDYGDSEQNWLSGYRGGWQETIPNAGAESRLRGMLVPFHGEASILPWRIESATGLECALSVDLRSTLRVHRTMRLLGTGAGVEVTTTVTNTGVQDVPFVWGHHPLFAADESTRVHLPDGEYAVEETQSDGIATLRGRWPEARDGAGRPVDLQRMGALGGSRLVYLHGNAQGWAVLRQPDHLPHVAMAWDPVAYPATWIWQNRGHPDFPWFGRMYGVAVEPQRSWPVDGLAGARERGQAITVAPGRSETSWLVLAFPPALPAQISGVDRRGRVVGREE